MADFYSAAPFVSHDGPDSDNIRAEVKVVKGFGIPKSIDPSDKGKAVKVVFPVDNTKWPSAGWAPADGNVMEVVQEAHDADEPLHFRIETIRKKGVDRSDSIMELTKGSDAARENAFKSLAAVKRETDDEWTISNRAMTRLDEDPTPEGGSSAYDHPIENLKPKSKPKGGGRESAPYELYNRDGSLNLGSFAVGVPAGMFSYAAELNNTNDLGFNEKQLRTIAKTLLALANKLQVAVHDGALESPDLNAASHTRARAILFETVRTLTPITSETLESGESLNKWAAEAAQKALALWRWSIAEVERIVE